MDSSLLVCYAVSTGKQCYTGLQSKTVSLLAVLVSDSEEPTILHIVGIIVDQSTRDYNPTRIENSTNNTMRPSTFRNVRFPS